MSNRIQWIDNCKALMLFAIVVGHFGYPVPFLPAYVGPVHVATFFFLSGSHFNPGKYADWRVFCMSKMKTLLVPYVALSLVFLLLDPNLYLGDLGLYKGNHSAISWITSGFWNDDNLPFFLLNLIGLFFEGQACAMSGPLWFVSALFLVEILLFVTLRNIKNRLSIGIIGILFLLAGWYCYIAEIRLPWNFDVVFISMFLSLFGYLMKPISLRETGLGGVKSIIIIPAISILFVIYVLGLNINGSISYYCNALGDSLVGFFIMVTSGVMLYVTMFMFLDKFSIPKILCRGITLFVSNAIPILAIHWWILMLGLWLFPGFRSSLLYDTIALLIVFLACVITIPLANRYFPWMVGKRR